MKTKSILLLIVLASMAGCTGWNFPQPLQHKPYTYLMGGAQLGRDQLENRSLAANSKFPMKGRDANEVLTILGQPQNVEVVERDTAENWYFVYYKNYVSYVSENIKQKYDRNEGTFVVRFYHDRVIDVVKID